jgi:hypothetical protein
LAEAQAAVLTLNERTHGFLRQTAHCLARSAAQWSAPWNDGGSPAEPERPAAGARRVKARR